MITESWLAVSHRYLLFLHVYQVMFFVLMYYVGRIIQLRMSHDSVGAVKSNIQFLKYDNKIYNWSIIIYVVSFLS